MRVSEIKSRGAERAQGLMGNVAFKLVRQKLSFSSYCASAGLHYSSSDPKVFYLATFYLCSFLSNTDDQHLICSIRKSEHTARADRHVKILAMSHDIIFFFKVAKQNKKTLEA